MNHVVNRLEREKETLVEVKKEGKKTEKKMGLTEMVAANGARIKGVHHSRESSTSSTGSGNGARLDDGPHRETAWNSPALICYPLVSKFKPDIQPTPASKVR